MPQTVLVLGGTGLLGAAIVGRLLEDGCAVIGVARRIDAARQRMPQVEWRQMDLSRLTRPDDWSALLAGADAVVNATGALQDGPADNVAALQVDAAIALFDLCARNGVSLVQISAAGVDMAGAAFMATKRRADDTLREMDFDWTILRPGLVLGPVAYGGSGMLRALAAMPLAIPITHAERVVRTVHVADIADAVSRCLAGAVPARRIYDLVADNRETFEDVILALRAWLGLAPARLVRLPAPLVYPLFWLGDVAGLLGWRSPMRSAAFVELARGVDGDPAPWREASGRSLGGVRETLRRIPAGVQDRWFSAMWSLKPVILAVLAGFWLLSGILGLVGRDAAVAVLTARGASPAFSVAAVFGGSLLDILIGLAIAFRRTAQFGLLAALALSLAYMIGAAVLAPDLWADPLGPMLKTLPATVLVLVALATLDDR